MAAGTANTTRFFLGSATVMLGTMARAMDLLPATDSIGLVKNVTVSSEPNFVDLTQGTKNQLVYSMLTSNPVKMAMEVFEYTSKNLNYAVSLDGTGVTTIADTAFVLTTTAITTNTTSIPSTGVAATGKFAVNDIIMLMEPGSEDQFLIRKVTVVGTNALTVDTAVPGATVNFSVGSTVQKVNTVDLGSTAANPYLSCKIAGLTADSVGVVIVLPKVRIVKGFSAAFNSEQYGNLPFEIEALDLISTDTLYSSFSNKKGALYTR